jgi:hypothetical protein
MRSWLVGGGAAVVLGIVALAVLLGRPPVDELPGVMRLFGPPAKAMSEQYTESAGTATFDHTPFDALLQAHVHGFAVDYDGLAADRQALEAYTTSLATAPFDELSRDGKLALLINAYNAFTLQLIVENLPLDSIKDIPADQRWDATRWTIGGRTLSLTQIEHDELRAKFVEPRIHFAINCASVGCPPLAASAYTEAGIDAELDRAARVMHENDRWLRIVRNSALSHDTVELSRIYLWYGGDFEQVAHSQVAFAARYRPELATGDWQISWLPYDWSLNRVPPTVPPR